MPPTAINLWTFNMLLHSTLIHSRDSRVSKAEQVTLANYLSQDFRDAL